jgi:hypothetical protein
MLRHEIPTHLDVQDKVIFGLTTRQTMHLLIGLAAAAFAWTHLSSADVADVIPLAARLAAVALCLCSALATALVRPYGRGVEEWAVVVLRFAATPRRAVWRPTPYPAPPLGTQPADGGSPATGSPDWFDYSPAVGVGRRAAGEGREATS